MVSLDLSHGSPAAPAGRRIWAQAGFDTRNALRNGENLLLTLIIPVAVLLILLLTPMGASRSPGQSLVAAGSLAVLATAFTSQAITTGFDRRYGVLRLLGLSPLGAKGLLAARTLVSLLIISGQLALLVVLTLTVGGWSPPGPAAVAQAVVVVGLGVCAYTAWPLDSLPWAGLAQWLPSGAMVSGLGGQPWQWPGMLVLAAWAVVGSLLASRWFRWES